MTETDAYIGGHLPVATDFMDRVGAAVLSGGFEQVDALVDSLDLEGKEDLLVGLAMRGKVNALVSGRVAHGIRLETPDGEWGREIRKLAMSCEVSDRTIHRWMSAYQTFAGLELTAAQSNAQVRRSPDESSVEARVEQENWDTWDEDEESLSAGFTLPVGDGVDGLSGQLAMRESVGEPYRERDSVTPSPEYENVLSDRAAKPSGRPVIPPDDIWLAFAEAQIIEEHPALGPSGGAAKSAKARWDRMSREEPLELLEQLEMIHEGGDVPDELAQALIEAEDTKAIKPDAITEPKKKRSGGGSAAKTPEGLMIAVRELHQQIVKMRDEQGAAAVVAKFGSPAVQANIQGLIHAATGCLNKVRSAVEVTKQTGGAHDSGGTEF